MPNFAERMRTKSLEFEIDLERVAASKRPFIVQSLKDLWGKTKDLIIRFDPDGVVRIQAKRARAAKLLEQAAKEIDTALKAISKEIQEDLLKVATSGVNHAVSATNTALGVAILTPGPMTRKELILDLINQTIVSLGPTQGAPVSTLLAQIRRKLGQDYENIIRAGFQNGATIKELIGLTGELLIGKGRTVQASLEAMTRTAFQAVAQEARRKTWAQNVDVIEGVQQISTLDKRTTPICQARDGKRWTLEGEPIGHSIPYNGGPPLHYQCRSAEIPVIINPLPKSVLDKIPPSQRASMYGPVDQSLTYEGWLKREVSKRGDQWGEDILGPSKFKLWKSGKLGLADMLDQRGNPLSVAELLKRHGS